MNNITSSTLLFSDNPALITTGICPLKASKQLEDGLKVISGYFAGLKLKIMHFYKNWKRIKLVDHKLYLLE